MPCLPTEDFGIWLEGNEEPQKDFKQGTFATFKSSLHPQYHGIMHFLVTHIQFNV